MSTERSGRRIREWGWNTLRALTPLLALLLLGFAYFLGIRTERSGFVREVIAPVMQRMTTPVLNAFRGGVPEVPRFALVLAPEALDSLARMRTEEAPSLTGPNLRFVGELHWNDSVLKAAIELQDRPTSSYSAAPRDMAAWRVQLAHHDTFLGMQRFQLLPVQDNAPLRTIFMSLILQDQGLPALPARFVEAEPPGGQNALFVMEALPDSIAWHRWGHTAAPIVRFGDELLLGTGTANTAAWPVAPALQSDWMAAPIITTLGGSSDEQSRAISALERFRTGKATASDVFDTDALARLLALSDVFGGQATVEWWNLSFFMHPATGRLIPLPRTPTGFFPVQAINAQRLAMPLRFPGMGSGFLERLLGDEALYRKYIATLDTMSTPGWADSTLARTLPGLTHQERILRGYHPDQALDRGVFAHNVAVIRAALAPKDLLLAYMEDRPGPLDRLAIANVHALPVEVLAVVVGTDTIPLTGRELFWPREKGKPLTYRMVPLNAPPNQSATPYVLARIVGTGPSVRVPIRTWSTFPALQ